MAHSNEDLIKGGYAAFGSGDLDTLNELFADDILWHVPGRSAISGDYRGKQEVFGFFGKLVELSGGTLRLDLHDVLANEVHAIVLAESSAEWDGRHFHDHAVHVFHIKDGKIVEFWGHAGDQYATDEFWG